MNADQIIGERVHILMRRDKISQEQLGQALGIAQASTSKKLLGNRSWTADEIIATARFLGVPVSEILPDDNYAPVLEGRGRGAARSKGLEPPTFWLVAVDGAPNDGFWTADRKLALLNIECQLRLDARSASIAGL